MLGYLIASFSRTGYILISYNIKLQLIFTNMAILTLKSIENSHLAKLHEIS